MKLHARCLVVPAVIYIAFVVVSRLLGISMPSQEPTAVYQRNTPPTPPPEMPDDLMMSPFPPPCANYTKPEASSLKDLQVFRQICPRGSYVFSAWYDGRRRDPVVRVVGVANVLASCHPEVCVVWYPHRQRPEVLRVKAAVVPETHDKSYGAVLYMCILRTSLLPYAVTLAAYDCSAPQVTLPVLTPGLRRNPRTRQRKMSRHRTNITICVTPLFNAFNDVDALVEMVEVNRLFGAGRFLFYNLSSSAQVSNYLRQYKSEGVAEVVQWPLMAGGWLRPHDIHYNGQLAAMQDCLYRNLYRTRYVAFLDLDEILVPHDAGDLMEVITRASATQQTEFCSFVFQNTFFRTDWPPESHSADLRTLKFLRRESHVWQHGLRSKYISPTSRIEVAGVHIPWICLGPRYDHFVPDTTALLHHYREWSQGETVDKGVLDKVMLRYERVIVDRVKAVKANQSQLRFAGT